ncbi:nuclear transport factor 2 family protein [Solimicrobium silvestre]|uniref:TPR repeat n=1 Tax=Solimicrobium silvestre TaxID=2099400 RepID=A0A2S9GVY3_9BURK|nr:nuclear transport factor 2 family protein [Solimicrobium silvestre]PRC91887.1 TPR repeat [Solimicrobium silvestre]
MTSKHTRSWFIALSLAIAALTSSAWADDSADVNKLIQNKQLPEAMQKADAYLVQHPKDAQMRFLKGLIFAEQNKTNEAIAVFTKLTEDYPDLPEPYNNLAVLFASSNQFDKARAALEMAIRTNPSYGTAHENLGDIYAKLASQAYDKALQLDSGNTGAKLKLTLIRNLFTNTNSAIATSTKVPPTTVAAAKPITNLPTKASSAKSEPTPTAPVTVATVTKPVVPVVAKAEPAKVEPAKLEPVKLEPAKPAPAKVEPVKAEPTKPEPKAVASNEGQNDVLKVVDAWAAAWSDKNTNAYLAFYSKDFQLPKGSTRKTWAEDRRVRIEGKGHISVKIDAPKVAINGNTATVKFRQIYNSDQLKADSRKTLVLNKQDGKWQIAQERTGG